MEQTALQKRIEERAKRLLLKDLKIATDKQSEIISLVGKEHFPEVLSFVERYDSFRTPNTQIDILSNKEVNNKIFENLLPVYIRRVTDDLLGQVDDIKWLLDNPDKEISD